MENVLKNVSVKRAIAALESAGMHSEIRVLSESARSAQEAADALGILVGQVASSIVFRLPNDLPLLVITSGRHRVDTARVAEELHVDELHRADADFVRKWSGYAIGGVSPLGWVADLSSGTDSFGYPNELTVVIDEALNDYDVVWAAAGHPHAVFPTTFVELRSATGAQSMFIGA